MNDTLTFRPYDFQRDEKAAIRIWRECGWPDLKKNRKLREAFRRWIAAGTADVIEFRGDAECMVNTHRGGIALLDTELPFRIVSSVTTGRPLRRMGGAGELTARAVMRAALDGDAMAGLGIFDQGFYDKLGFGNFPYNRLITFDPLNLNVPKLRRAPVRVTKKDLSRIVAGTDRRMGHHGLVKIPGEEFPGLMIASSDEGFGLGFEDENGRLTHHFWAEAKGERGPCEVWWMVYRDYGEMIELLSLMKSLGDQIRAFMIREPWGIQFQDFQKRPFRSREISEGGRYENKIRAVSYKQARILDMEQTLEALRLPGGEVRFNLNLSDPIVKYLPEDAPWRGLEGKWIIELRQGGSTGKRGTEAGLPEMKASVNAFTRLIFGVASPAGLAASDNLTATPELLTELGEKLRLPVPDMVQIF